MPAKVLADFTREVRPELNKKPDEVKDFGTTFTILSTLLADAASVDIDDLPLEADWGKSSHGHASVDYLSTKTSQGGGIPRGCDLILREKATLEENWVRMHLITAQADGKGTV